MSKESKVFEPPLQDAFDLETVPVQVVFELGRMQFSVAELRRLAPGSIAPLARPIDEAFDIIANGKRIGYGGPVRIGDSLGVRVTRLVADD